MADKLMYITSSMMIYKIPPSVDYNKWMKRLDTQLNKPTNLNSIIVPNAGLYLIKYLIFLNITHLKY